MSHNDRQMNGQHRPNSILDQLELPPARKGTQRLARLRTAWRKSWEEGGFLHQRSRPVTLPCSAWPVSFRRLSCATSSGSPRTPPTSGRHWPKAAGLATSRP
ncbi:hypothetical protein EF914_29450 [Streptomyces sp. WAC05458]|nr:hypothetical protein EF914_29450 [Streptomyces sp. WAC05458]